MDFSRLRTVLAGLVIVAGLSGIVVAQGAAPQAKPPAQDEFFKGAVIPPMEGLTLPVPVRQFIPKYAPDGMRNKIQGLVTIQTVVAADGTVDRARVTESLDRDTGLDDSALEAAKKWLFTPGTLGGKAVPVAIELKLEFRLH